VTTVPPINTMSTLGRSTTSHLLYYVK